MDTKQVNQVIDDINKDTINEYIKRGIEPLEDRDYISINKKLISTSPRIKEEKIIEKLTYLNCVNDIAYVDYNKYGKKGHDIKPIGDIFVDNIILGVPYSEDDIDEMGNNRLVGVNNVLLRQYFKDCSVKAILTHKEDRIQKYKIDTANVNLPYVFEVLNSGELEKKNIKFLDIDITRDFTGCFCKDELINVIEMCVCVSF